MHRPTCESGSVPDSKHNGKSTITTCGKASSTTAIEDHDGSQCAERSEAPDAPNEDIQSRANDDLDQADHCPSGVLGFAGRVKSGAEELMDRFRNASPKTQILSAVALILVIALAIGGIASCSRNASISQSRSYSVTENSHNTLPSDNGDESAGSTANTNDSSEFLGAKKDASSTNAQAPSQSTTRSASDQATVSLENIPEWNGRDPYVEIDGNIPKFNEIEMAAKFDHEYYAPLDSLGRCGITFALVGPETQSKDKRGDIGDVTPSGWKNAKYPNVNGGYVYNRCHLLGYQLTAENANPNNLITGTRYLNVNGMLPFENKVAEYVEGGGHVRMKSTPIFIGSELVARGVHMMAQSVEDGGKTVSFNVYCYNVQPGIGINYQTGETSLVDPNATDDSNGSSSVSSNGSSNGGSNKGGQSSSKTPASSANPAPAPNTEPTPETGGASQTNESTFILNTNTKKFHVPGCASEKKISAENRQEIKGTISSLENMGYSRCKSCLK